LVLFLAIYLRRIGGEADASVLKPKDYYGINILPLPPLNKEGKTDVSGTIKKPFPKDYHLWVFRVCDNGRIYPLRECDVNDEQGTWAAHNCDRGGTSSDRRWFSANIVGPDGIALISYVLEAGQIFKPIRDQLVSMPGINPAKVGYLPSVAFPPPTILLRLRR
jgi:hypothetical protein